MKQILKDFQTGSDSKFEGVGSKYGKKESEDKIKSIEDVGISMPPWSPLWKARIKDWFYLDKYFDDVIKVARKIR